MADATARPEDVDIGQLGSMFGVQTRNDPDYLEYDIRGRGYTERLFFNCGASYLGFMLGGGVYGTVQGLRLAPANAPLRVRTNALMNGFGKHGATAGNAAGAVALMYTSFECMAESAELDKICGDQAWVRFPALVYQCVACDDERRRIQLLLLVRIKPKSSFLNPTRCCCLFVTRGCFACITLYAQVNPVAAGALTGGLFKAGAGVRGAALASAIGAGLAAAAHFQPGLR